MPDDKDFWKQLLGDDYNDEVMDAIDNAAQADADHAAQADPESFADAFFDCISTNSSWK